MTVCFLCVSGTPSLGHQEDVEEENLPFQVGDHVRVELEQDILQELQESGAGSHPSMLAVRCGLHCGDTYHHKGKGRIVANYRSKQR